MSWLVDDLGLEPEFVDHGHYERRVAVDAGLVVGFLNGLFDQPVPKRAAAAADPGPQAWINWMGVQPAARLRGVGQALVRAFADEARQHGCTYLAAMISWTDDPAGRVAFFRRCGLQDLVPGKPDDIVGAPIADILSRQ